MSRKFAHEKNAARDKARRTPYGEPVPIYCLRLVLADQGGRRMVRCGGELHQVEQLHGEPVSVRTTICEKCHHVTEYRKGVPVARNIDARKKARALADELDRSGVLVEADGPRRIAVALEGKHWKVRAVNGAYLYSFSTTPSDHRSIQNTVSALRKMNVRWGEEAEKITASNGDDRSKHHAPPSDTELTPVQERGIAVRARLSTLQQALGASNTDLVRVGMDAAKKRKLWHYKTVESGVVQIGRFLSGKTYGDNRSLDFFEAVCDELEGVPAKQFGTATEVLAVPVPVPPAPEPEPEPPAPEPAPTAHLDQKIEIADLQARLEARVRENADLKNERAKLIEKFQNANEQVGKETKKSNELREQLERQRSETISAQANARAMKEELEDARRQLDEQGAPQSDDPLFIKALRRLVTNSSTDQEIEEAFEMAMQIYRGGS